MAGFIIVDRAATSFNSKPRVMIRDEYGNRRFARWEGKDQPESFPIYEKAYEIAQWYPDWKITLMNRPNLEEFILQNWEQQITQPGYIMTPEDHLIYESREHTKHPWSKDTTSPWYQQQIL